MDNALYGREEDRDAQTREKMKSQTYVEVDKKSDGRDGQTGRDRRGLTPVYLRGSSALT